MPNQTDNLEEKLIDEKRENPLRKRLLEVPSDKPVKLNLKKGTLKFYQWASLRRDKKGNIDEDPLIRPEVLTAIVYSMDYVSDKLTPPTRPHCPNIKVDKEDYFMRLTRPYVMIGYLAHSSRGFTLETHPDFNTIDSNSPVIDINAVESFEVL